MKLWVHSAPTMRMKKISIWCICLKLCTIIVCVSVCVELPQKFLVACIEVTSFSNLAGGGLQFCVCACVSHTLCREEHFSLYVWREWSSGIRQEVASCFRWLPHYLGDSPGFRLWRITHKHWVLMGLCFTRERVRL